ncbi:putative bifunctional diguanylate cyclase/phosphodiesterase [Micromonosporaceae bacterium Da 78-11]
MGTAGISAVGGIPPWRSTRTLVVSLAVAVVGAAWFTLGLTRTVPGIIGWLPLLVAVPVAAVASWRAGTPTRTFWRYVSVGISLLGIAAGLNAHDSLSGDKQGQHISGFTSAVYLSGLLMMMVGLLRIPGARRPRADWVRFGMDIATVIVTVLTFAWHLIYPRWETWFGAGAADTSSALTVVGGGFICVFAFVKVAFTGTGPIDRRSLHLLALTGAVGAGGGSMAPLLADRPYLNTGQVILPVTCLMLCLAADRQVRAARGVVVAPRVGRARLSAMPYAAVLSTGGLLIYSAVRHTADIVAIAVGAVTVTMVVAVRQMVALRDNAALLDHLDHQATHDALTGLANRTVLTREADAALALDPARVSVALIDLDDFKAINDDLGHAVGDALLTEVAVRIGEHLPPGSTVARLGGDEYAMVLCGAPGEHERALARIATELRRPVQAAGHAMVVEASIGLALARVGDTSDELLRRADVAMYEAKSQGKGRYVVYRVEMDQRSAEQARLAADLRAAFDGGQLYLVYQPIVTLDDGALYGVEALIRWQHPQRGPIGPVTFIPPAERTGLIVPLGAWILTEACRQAVRWQQELGPAAPRTVSVNVSARQLREAGFAGEVAGVLRRTGLAPDRLTVEVTETAVFDGGSALDELHAIKALGVNIALDDFGTGHSSLGLLRTCPVDVLKVDKSFVDTVTEGGEHAVVAAALIQISDGLHLRAVAEGVETAEQAAELRRLGYRLAQGYHFGRPMSAADIADYRPLARIA